MTGRVDGFKHLLSATVIWTLAVSCPVALAAQTGQDPQSSESGNAQRAEHDLLVRGAYEAVYDVGEDRGGLEGELLKAHAANMHAYYVAGSEDERKQWLRRAAAAARRALQLDPNAAQAHFELGRAEGLLAQSSGVAQNLGRAGEIRDAFKRTLELDPEHPGAQMALAQLHLELSERGVAWLFGGDRRLVLPLARGAVEAAPHRIDMRVELGQVLLRLNLSEEAVAQLREALSLGPESHADRIEAERARRILNDMGH